ncbi:MAG: ATP-grasp domain-containing protein [Porticoccaceae bacterium]
MTTKPIRTLVLDADTVPALAVVRSLVKQHQLVDVASAASAPIASYSHGVRRCFRYPDALLQPEHFLEWLEGLLAEESYDLVIPVTERTLVPLSSQRHRFAGAPVAMADAQSLDQVLDKKKTFDLAQRLGVATPHSLCLTGLEQLDIHKDELAYPVVIKPSHSVAQGANGYSKRNVSYAYNERELRVQCEHCLKHSPVILQNYFHGTGAGIELIARDGEILYSFQHIRLHEVPLTGGGSSFRVSSDIEPVLLGAAETLIGALRWTGVAMVEFKWQPDTGRYCLMEINGRFWGSLPLALAAGADFPAMLAELLLSGSLRPYPAYRRGVYCRNLSSDLMWHEMVLRRPHSAHCAKDEEHGAKYGEQPLASETPAAPPYGKIMRRDLVRLLSPHHHFDTQSLADPLPGLIEIRRLAAGYGTRLSGVIADKRFALQQRLLWRNGTVREKIRAARTVLFICHGNINRSPAAEIVMKSMLPANCATRVHSCGFHQQAGRPADWRMRQIAHERGFDLSYCNSICISDALLNESDVIFVMEKKHFDDLVCRNPAATAKTFLLGPGAITSAQGATDIPDPYNQSEDTYRACFLQIHRAVSRLSDMIRGNHAG